jgi:hypothetical protein
MVPWNSPALSAICALWRWGDAVSRSQHGRWQTRTSLARARRKASGEARHSQHVERPIRHRDVPARAAPGAPRPTSRREYLGHQDDYPAEHEIAVGDQSRAAHSCSRLEGIGDSHTECGMQCMHRAAVYLRRSRVARSRRLPWRNNAGSSAQRCRPRVDGPAVAAFGLVPPARRMA